MWIIKEVNVIADIDNVHPVEENIHKKLNNDYSSNPKLISKNKEITNANEKNINSKTKKIINTGLISKSPEINNKTQPKTCLNKVNIIPLKGTNLNSNNKELKLNDRFSPKNKVSILSQNMGNVNSSRRLNNDFLKTQQFPKFVDDNKSNFKSPSPNKPINIKMTKYLKKSPEITKSPEVKKSGDTIKRNIPELKKTTGQDIKK